MEAVHRTNQGASANRCKAVIEVNWDNVWDVHLSGEDVIEGKTRGELQEIWKLSATQTKVRLKKLVNDGKVQKVMGYRPDCTGRKQRMPVYLLEAS